MPAHRHAVGENLAKVLVERVGEKDAHAVWTTAAAPPANETLPVRTSAEAIALCLGVLTDPRDGVLGGLAELDAVGFKPVCAKGITGCREMTDEVLAAMEEFADYICPMHNEDRASTRCGPSGSRLPSTPMVGLFETFFFQEWPEYARIYSIPWDWTQKYDVRRMMGHGASHFYVNRRIAELLGRNVRRAQRRAVAPRRQLVAGRGARRHDHRRHRAASR